MTIFLVQALFSTKDYCSKQTTCDTWSAHEVRVQKGNTLDSHGFGKDYAMSPFHCISYIFTSMLSKLDPLT